LVLVAFVPVVVANDGIVVRVPVASTGHVRTAVFVVPSGVVQTVITFPFDYLMAAKTLLRTVIVGFPDLFALGVLAVVPVLIVFHVLRLEAAAHVVLFWMQQITTDLAWRNPHPRFPVLECRLCVADSVRNWHGGFSGAVGGETLFAFFQELDGF